MFHRKQSHVLFRAIEPLESRTLFAAGILDPSFNFNGIRTFDFRQNDLADAVAFQLNNRAIVVGSTQNQNQNPDALIARFNQDGSIDTTFGSAGTITLDLGGSETATAVTLQPTDGKILVVGTVTGATSTNSSDIFIARYTTDGVLDTTFNTTGVRVFDLGGQEVARAVAVNSTGRIIIAGASVQTNDTAMAIITLNPNGTLDPSFGGTGAELTTPGTGVIEEATGIALDPNSNGFYVSGFQSVAANSSRFMVAKFNADGTLNTSFGQLGRTFASFGNTYEAAFDIAVDPASGGIVAAGTTASGQPDLPPGVLPISTLGLTVPASFAIARFTATGALDPTFNSTGEATENFTLNSISGNENVATSLAVQPNGAIVVGGFVKPGTGIGNSEFAVSRLTSSGTPDFSFGTSGQTVTPLSGSAESFATRLQPDGKIFQVGTVDTSTGGTDIAMVRYLNDISTSTGPALSVNNVAATEGNIGNTNATFTVTLSPANTTQVVTVHFQTADGTAIAGQDYSATSGTLTFAPGVTTQTVNVPIIGDFTPEPNETFTLQLSSATNATITLAQGTGTILNDDGTGVGAVSVVSVTPSSFPKNIVGGAKNAHGTVTVRITNPTASRTSGIVQVQILASTDGTVTDATPVVGQVSKHISLAPGKSTNIKVKVTLPAVSADTNYFFVARASGIGATSINATISQLTVQAPTIALVSSSTPKPITLHAGQHVALHVPIKNTGNTQARGTVTYDLLIMTTPDFAPPLFTLPSSGTNTINLKPGQRTTQVIHFDLPADLSPGSYTLVVKIVNTLTTPANATDGAALVSIPLTVV